MTPTNEQQHKSTQGNIEEKDNQLGGTPNMPLDALKKESHNKYYPESNPDQIDDPNDLHEIQVDDDLDEPDADEYQPDLADEQYSKQEQASDQTGENINPATQV